MPDTNSSIFRQKSLDGINDNTDLSSKIKITTPGVIAVFVAICVIAAGFIVWGFLYEIESTIPVLLIKDDQNQTKCLMHTGLSDYTKICKYKKVYLGEDGYTLSIDENEISFGFINLTEDENNPISWGIFEQELDYKTGDKYYLCDVDNLELPKKSAIGYAVVKKESPFAYLINYNWTSDSNL